MPARHLALHAIGNAHIDPVWLWRWPEGLETIRATFRSVLDRMDETPEFRFSGSSAAFYAWLAEVDPAMLAAIRARVQEGRWEIVGGWWVQPDANIPCGESLVRQALYGQRFFEQAFGVRATVGYNPDTFGHAGTLPQILRGAGLTRYVFMRPGPHEMEIPASVFRWRSPDGSEVLTARIHRSYCTWADDLAEHVASCAGAAPPALRDYVVFYGVGNHGGGPTRRNIESLQRMAQAGDPAGVRMSTLGAFFEAVEGQVSAGAEVPVVADELQHHARGCYTAHSEVKRQNRRVEHLLLTAERFAAAAWWHFGQRYPQADLAEAWQALLFNQFHDILAGTSLPEAYEDARDLFGHAAALGGRALNFALQGIGGRVDTRGEGAAVLVFNPLPWTTRVPVEVERGSARIADEHGRPVPAQAVQPTTEAGQRRSCFVAELPALGYRLYRQDADGEAPAAGGSLEATPTSLRSDRWQIDIDPDSGSISRLHDRRTGVDVLSGPGDSWIVLDDPSDTWSHDVVSFRQEIGRFGGARVAVEEDGPVRAALRIESTWGRSTLLRRIILYRDLDLIECRAVVNWQEESKMLKVAFPLSVTSPVATCETAYGSIRRACGGAEEPCQQWVDVTGQVRGGDGSPMAYGMALLNDGKYGYDVLGAELRMSVLRSPAYAHHDPAALDPDRRYSFIDQGIQHVAFRMVPHSGGWLEAGVPRRAWELNAPPLWVNEAAHDGSLAACGSFLECDHPGVLLTVCKAAEDGAGLVVRGYQTGGAAAQVALRMPLAGLSWEARFAPHQIRTWRVRPGDTPPVELADLLEEPVDRDRTRII